MARSRADLGSLLESPEAKRQFSAASDALEGAALVRQMREKADGGEGISQAELARRLEVEPPRISVLERGGGPGGPTYALLKRIARACRVDFSITVESVRRSRQQ
jgi:hypothetical protein